MDYQGATREQLYELHRLVAEALLEALSQPHERLNAALLAVARKFLKDNGVSSDVETVRDMRRALEELPALSLPFSAPKKPQ